MRKLLNTLYVTNPEAYLALEGETVVIWQDEQKLGQFPLLLLEGIVCFSYDDTGNIRCEHRRCRRTKTVEKGGKDLL